MDSELLGEGELEVSEPLLAVERDIKSGILLVLIWLEIPSWRLAMDGVDEIGIAALSEWIGNELGLLHIHFASCGESAFGVAEPGESGQIVVLEVDGKHQLGLQVGG